MTTISTKPSPTALTTLPSSRPSHQSCALVPGTESEAHQRLCLWIPGTQAQTVNHSYGRRGARSYLTPAAREWKRTVAGYVAAESWVHAFPLAPQLKGARISYRFVGHRADGSNLVKLTEDGIADALGLDDRHFATGGIESLTATRSRPAGVRLEIEALAASPRGTAL